MDPREVSPFEVWAAKNIKGSGNNEVRMKELLYRVSPHLHPRIVESLSFDAENSTLKIKVKVTDQCSQEFINRIMQDLHAFNPHQQDGNLTISVPETNFESNVEKNYSLYGKEAYIRIARNIKDTTDEFDYEIIEKKPSGNTSGVKLGNAYIKKMDKDKINLINFFTYVALHHFLGTKSPQIDLIKDNNNDVWIVSRGLSQTYSKQDKVKIKKFTTLDSSPSFVKGHSLESTTVNENVNMKSVGKLMLLSVIFGLADLDSKNMGIISSGNTSKLSIVDFVNKPVPPPDFSVATSWNELYSVFENQYKQYYSGTYLLQKLIYKLKNDIPHFIQAIYAILQPLTENKQKTKSIFYVKRELTIFEDKKQTFAEVIEKAYSETLEKLNKIGFDPSSTQFSNTSSKPTIKEILNKQKDMLINAGLNLEKAVNLINIKDVTILQQLLTHYDGDLINELMKRGADFSNTFAIALSVAINYNNEHFLCYLFEQININQYLQEHEHDLPVIRQGLLLLKTMNRDLFEKYLDSASMVTQLNLFSLPEKDIRDGVKLYANTELFFNVLKDYVNYRITTVNQLIEFISVLLEARPDPFNNTKLAHDAIILCLNKAVQQNNIEAIKLCLGKIGLEEVTIPSNNNAMDVFTLHYLDMHNINVKFNQNTISENNLVGLIHAMHSHIQYLKVTDPSNPFLTLCDNLLNVYSIYKTKVDSISPDRLANLRQLASQVGKACYLYMNTRDSNSCFARLSQSATQLCLDITEAHKKEGTLSFTSEIVSAFPLPFFQNLKNPGGFLSSKLSTLIQEAIDKSKTPDKAFLTKSF